MKINKIFTINVDIAKKLESIQNKSALVDKLLSSYFEENEDPKNLKLKIMQLEIMAEAQKKAEALTLEDVKDDT